MYFHLFMSVQALARFLLYILAPKHKRFEGFYSFMFIYLMFSCGLAKEY